MAAEHESQPQVDKGDVVIVGLALIGAIDLVMIVGFAIAHLVRKQTKRK